MSTADALDSIAREILTSNDKGNYTIPTKGLYPYQWNWDSAFAAFGFAQFDIDRAWTELDTLFSGQWDNGMVPQILFHEEHASYFPGPDVWGCRGPLPSSGITQPPVAASMARLILDKDRTAGLQRVAPLYDKILAWHQWFIRCRLDQGAVCITHPWESGRDNAADWDDAMASINPEGVGSYVRRDTAHVDSAMRPTKEDYDRYIWLVQLGRRLDWVDEAIQAESPFRVADPGMTFILLRAQRDLAGIGTALGRDVSELESGIAVLEAGAQTLWNAELGSYDARNVKTGRFSQSISNASFLCWYAGLDSPQMRTVLNRIMNQVQYGVPSLDPGSEKFDGLRYWRGPVWGVLNMLIGLGMEEKGIPAGRQLKEATGRLIREHGIAEYFDPRDGAPAGGNSFTWTAAIWLGWASPNASKD